jgi:hypothetical protein
MRMKWQLLLGLLAATTACSHDASTSLQPAVDHDAEGSWAPDNGGAIIPGNSWIVALRESSGTVTGTGSFAGEAGPFGALEVTGTVANDSVHLRIVYVYEPTVFTHLVPDTAQFDGLLVSRDRIDGRLGRDGGFTTFRLLRAVPYDPR